jgi:hypothetical protein
MVTPYYVSWHTDYDNYLDVHTYKKKYLNSEEEASDYFYDLGDSWAKRLVKPEGTQTFSYEWAKFIPGETIYMPFYVTWYKNTDENEGVQTFKIKYFDNEASQQDFYNELELGDGYNKEMSGKDIDL